MIKHINDAYKAAYPLSFRLSSRLVIMSDCHRGDGGWSDDFAKNQNIFFAALTHYNQNAYTYIELGDGDELWENRKFSDISVIYNNVFWLMKKFHEDNRLYLIYGNHDIVKKYDPHIYDTYVDTEQKKNVPLFLGIQVHESILLQNPETEDRIFLLHGHQADFFNDYMWKVSRFLVRYLWRPLEILGTNDPTSAAKNNKIKSQVEKHLRDFSEQEKVILIAGHTHRPVFPAAGEPAYFNDGSCVHPRCITAIEISEGCISLVKWCYMTREDGAVYIGREVLAGPEKISDYQYTDPVVHAI
ncbi:MAG: metallophosphoesterase [Intestinibacillus sp.]